MTIFFILGTRPEIIKVSPVIKVCEQRKVDYKVVFTDQHYDAVLCDQFFSDLELPGIKSKKIHLKNVVSNGA
ncbi:MAG: hypothetical protein ACFE75_12960, partial [Candidatus Hodarchaeota archaeon]